ncbi:MAG: ABC transporter permease [Candidatus Eremiobacteraeota bacterium]|nr:ABC transporter permease [Candidatus Eremiobacteraeota bacterium]
MKNLFFLNYIEALGAAVLGCLTYIGGIILLLLDSVKWIIRGILQFNLRIRLFIEQAAVLGVNSFSIVTITTCFTGAVISLQLAEMAVRYGAGRFVGGGVAISMARELAPMLTAIVVAGRAGSAITAEIGSMRVTEQIDALKAMATSPVKYLVVPRLLACSALLPMLCLFSMFAGVLGGAVVAHFIAGVRFDAYFDSIRNMMAMKDIYKGLFKSFIFAIEIAMISCYQGLNTEGGAAGVGKATTGSVVYSMLTVFITNFMLTALMFPIGQ